MRLKLIIAYDGRPFLGWQSQPGGNTVQDFLQDAAAKIAGGKIGIHGAGRTDTGVHALAQCAHFDAPDTSRMSAADWRNALNANLPAAIRILDCSPVPADFHARFSAGAKEYRYRICTDPVLPPLLHGLVWHHPRRLDPAVLEQGARLFEGAHDFRNFAASRGTQSPLGGRSVPRDPGGGAIRKATPGADAAGRTERTIYHAVLEQEGPGLVVLAFRGNGFLYKMVRLMTGSLVRCAEEKASLSWIRELLTGPPDSTLKSSYCAPPDGLYLARVEYD